MKRLIHFAEDEEQNQDIKSIEDIINALNINSDEELYELIISYLLTNFDEKDFVKETFEEGNFEQNEEIYNDDSKLAYKVAEYLLYACVYDETFMNKFFNSISIHIDSQNLSNIIRDIKTLLTQDEFLFELKFFPKYDNARIRIDKYLDKQEISKKYFNKDGNKMEDFYTVKELKKADDSIGDEVIIEPVDSRNRDSLFVVLDNEIVLTGGENSKEHHYDVILKYMEDHQNENKKFKDGVDALNETEDIRGEDVLNKLFKSYCFGHINSGLAFIDTFVDCNINDVLNAIKSNLNVDKVYDCTIDYNFDSNLIRSKRVAKKKRLIRKHL